MLFAGNSTSMCLPDGNFVTMEFTQNFGSYVTVSRSVGVHHTPSSFVVTALTPAHLNHRLPLLVGDSSKLAHAGVGSMPKLLITKGEDGTKESEQCSNRGNCDQSSGVCACYTGYTTSAGNGLPGDRGDCGAPQLTIIACPGEIACSGHGYCSGAPQFRCFCVAGWTSGDCSVRTCPRGIAWFDLPISDDRAHSLRTCSGVGVCDTSKGECVCPTPFDGAACERMKCPGLDDPCNGNGRCLTMAELALEARNNGEPLSITYGKTPNKPTTWDFDKIQGCICDDGFEGHDCSRRSCPRGDDPRTTNQQREVQTIVCRHTQVTAFTLIFRGERTQLLPSGISALDLENALSAVKSIGRVRVSYSAGAVSPACTLGGTNKITIEFLTALGDLPPLRVDMGANAAQLPLFTIDCDGVGTSKRGTVENAECSNKCVYLVAAARWYSLAQTHVLTRSPALVSCFLISSQRRLQLRDWNVFVLRRYDQQRRAERAGTKRRLRTRPVSRGSAREEPGAHGLVLGHTHACITHTHVVHKLCFFNTALGGSLVAPVTLAFARTHTHR